MNFAEVPVPSLEPVAPVVEPAIRAKADEVMFIRKIWLLPDEAMYKKLGVADETSTPVGLFMVDEMSVETTTPLGYSESAVTGPAPAAARAAAMATTNRSSSCVIAQAEERLESRHQETADLG